MVHAFDKTIGGEDVFETGSTFRFGAKRFHSQKNIPELEFK
jgi:hypothetical protein